MPSYLEIALRVVDSAKLILSERERGSGGSSAPLVGQPSSAKTSNTSESKPSLNECAPCGAPGCAGCYDVDDQSRIHPPRIGEDYRKWLERWRARGKVQ